MIKFALFIILCIPVVQGNNPYFIIENKTTWRQAKEVCDMVINLNLNRSSNDFVVDVGHNFTLKDDVWVGLYMKMTGFEFIGCAGKPYMKADVISVQNTPGLCYSECSDTDFVGLRGNECYCLKKIPDEITGECSWSCQQNDWMSCGGENLQSIYRRNSAVLVHDAEGNGDCLMYQNYISDESKKIWEKCSKSHPPLCMEGNTYKPADVTQQHTQWNISIQHCNEKTLRPSYHEDLSSINETVNPSWTGIIRSDVLYTIKDFNDSQSNIQYGYLKTDSNTLQTILLFTDSSKKEKLTLCHNKQINEQNSGDESSANTGMAVGVSIAIVMVVIIVVLAVIFLKRGQKIPAFCKKRAHCKDPDNNGKHKTNVSSSNVNMNFRQLGRLDTSMIGENGAGRKEESDYAGTYDVLEQPEDETYNVTMPQNRSSSEKENNYNSIRLDTNNTYDHAHKVKNARHKSEDDYDVTEIAAMKLKENTNAGLDEFRDIDNDAYNHIDLEPKKSNITDNVYSAPWQQKGSTGDDFSKTRNDIHDEEDTYNHINEQNTK